MVMFPEISYQRKYFEKRKSKESITGKKEKQQKIWCVK